MQLFRYLMREPSCFSIILGYSAFLDFRTTDIEIPGLPDGPDQGTCWNSRSRRVLSLSFQIALSV